MGITRWRGGNDFPRWVAGCPIPKGFLHSGWPGYQAPLSCAASVVRTSNLSPLHNHNHTEGGGWVARRIAAILLLEPALDANYETVKAHTVAWPPKV